MVTISDEAFEEIKEGSQRLNTKVLEDFIARTRQRGANGSGTKNGRNTKRRTQEFAILIRATRPSMSHSVPLIKQCLKFGHDPTVGDGGVEAQDDARNAPPAP